MLFGGPASETSPGLNGLVASCVLQRSIMQAGSEKLTKYVQKRVKKKACVQFSKIPKMPKKFSAR